jgi:hypothetical protein
MKNYWKYAGVGFLIAGAVFAFLLMPGSRPPKPILPVPNGYDDFLNAAQQAVSLEHRNYGDGTDEELRNLVNLNQPALAQARAGFKHQTRVTTDYSLSPDLYAAQHMPVLANLKKLALAFRAEGELAAREGRTSDAAQVYLDLIRFGQEICRGGLLIDRLVGIACERMSLDQLQALAPELQAAACKNAARTLENMDGSRDSLETVLAEEQRWALATTDWRGRIFIMLRPKALKAARDNAVHKVAEVQLRERELTLDLAVRAYRFDHGSGPQQASQLVPEFLAAIPKNPVTGADLSP